MKKLYLTTLSAAAALSLSAAPSVTHLSISTDMQASLKAETVDRVFTTNSRSVSLKEATEGIEEISSKANTLDLAFPDAWASIGEGTWVEGPLDLFTDIESGKMWTVQIEESTTDPGTYRLIPYCEGSTVAAIMGQPDTNYIIIHASDPNKVWTEDFTPYGAFPISQLCPETEWPEDYNMYGTLQNKVISFPANSHAVQRPSGWALSNKDGKFTIYLPGAEVKDYSFNADITTCADDNINKFVFETGADIATVKAGVFKGSYPASLNNLNIIAASGTTVTANALIQCSDGTEEPGKYTVLLSALDAEGTVRDGMALYFYIISDDSGNWTSLGKAEFTDPVMPSAEYATAAATYDVDVEENKNTPGYYRLVNPYKTNPVVTAENIISHNHNHYIYIDATNPDEVKIEDSPVGIDMGYGDMSIWSPFSRYTQDTAEDLIAAGFAAGKKDGLTITFPKGSVFFSEKYYNNSTNYVSTVEGKVVLPDNAGVDGITIDKDNNAPVEYFNLQGIRVDQPANGLYIRRQGSATSKVVIR